MPRSFRYAYLRGDRQVELARVELLSEQEKQRAWQGKETGVEGPFGLDIK